MSLILIIGKSCLFCSQSHEPQDKSVHQGNLAAQTSDFLNECLCACEEGRCEYERWEEALKLVELLRLKCFECSGDVPIVYDIIKNGPAREIKEDIEFQEKAKCKIRESRGIIKEGNVFHVESWVITKKSLKGT
jgi:hypothetical protein